MALALCLTLLPTPAWAEETDTPEDGAIVQEQQQEKTPAAESPAISEQAAENGIAAQNGGDSTVENAVAEVTIGSTTKQYADINEAFAAAQQADSATVKLLANVTTTSEIKVDSGTFTIDLNGKKWEGTDTHTLLVSGGNVTVTSTDGVGTITCSSNNAIYVDSGATVHVKSGVRLNRLYTMKNAKLTLDVGVIITVKFFTQADNIAPFLTGKALQRCDENGTLIEGQYKSIYDSYRVDETGCVIVIEHKSCTGTPSTENPCKICGYDGTPTKPTEPENPNPDVAEVNGTKYKTLAAAIQAANGADITLLTIVSENVVVDGDNIKAGIILGNGATIDDIPYPSNWVADRNGIPLTMEAGEITLKNGALAQFSASSSANVAIALKGGTLIVETTVTKIIGSNRSNSVQHAAIEVTGGVLDLQGNTLLDGGLTMSGNAQLKNKLTAGAFTNSGSDTYSVSVEGSSQYTTVFDLLEAGYAFAKYDESAENKVGAIVDGSVKQLTEDVIVVAHTHSIEEGQSACACGKQFEAGIPANDGTITYYETIDEAFANVKANETVKLIIDSDDRSRSNTIYVVGGPYTFDLNGHRVGHRTGDDFNQAFLQVGDPEDGSPGTLTVLDSSAAQTGYFYELELYNGDLTVESGSFYQYWESATTATGTMTFKGGTVDVFTVTSRNVETKISGGTFGLVENNIGGKPGDLLADNRAFFNRNNGNFVNGYDDNYSAVRDVVVKNHTHNIVDGSCECGFTCAHDWSDKNGVCKKANCGYHCPHNAGAAEADGVWACNTCGQTVTAMVTAPGGAITYYADGYVNENVKSGLYFAIKAAETGSTVAALGGKYLGGYVTGNKTLTLDMSNGKTIDGTLYVGEKDKGNKLIVRGSTEISDVIVDSDNTLDLTGWTGRIGSLTVQNGGKATLNGGTFATLNFNGAEAGSLLASGYAFQNAGTGEYVEYSSTADMENVKVVKCPHSGVKLKEDHTGAECKYCGASFAATLDDAPYGTIDEAITYWLANGGTLKLYADYTAATEKATWTIVSGEHSIDLNGHRMSVKGDGAFKPTNNMHLTVTDGTERGQIDNILLDGSQRGSFTLENGYVCNLEMTGGAVVALKGGSVDELDVQNCSANTNLSIQGGSLGKLNIKDWADGMHVSATGGSLGAYNLPSGKILADVLDHQYYAEGTSLDKQADAAAQSWEKFIIQQAPYDFGSTSKAADVPINGSIPFRVDSPSENVGVYDVKWYRRTTSGAEHMTENRVAGVNVNVNDTLDVFCVITGLDRPGGAMQWQVAVKGYTINVVPANLDGATVTLDHDSFVFDGNSHTPTVTSVTLDNKALTNDDYTVSVDKKTNAGTYELIVTGTKNYTGTVRVPWTIQPHTIGAPVSGSTLTVTKTYDGTGALPAAGLTESSVTFKSEAKIDSISEVTLKQGEDFTISGSYVGDNVNVGTHSAKIIITLKNTNYTFDKNTSAGTMADGKITKADAPEVKPYDLPVVNNKADTYELNLNDLLPTLPSGREFGDTQWYIQPDSMTALKNYYGEGVEAGFTVDANQKSLLYLKVPATADKSDVKKIGAIKVTVTPTNYNEFELTINVNATNKIVPTGEPTLSTETLTYGQALSAIKLSGKLHDNVNNKDIEGTFTWADGTVKPSAGSYEAAWKFTPADGDTYAETTGTVSITVNKAKPTGDPIYTRITAANKTLTDAALKPNTSWPTGTIQWVDKDGKELPDTTEVKANTAYKWIFTPTGADAGNYTTATGELILYSVSTGGSSSGSTVKTDTVTNPDGSVTKTETKKDGTVVETTTGKDGSVSQTTTNPNGSSVTETKAADGSTGTVKTDKHGQTTAETTLSSKAIETAKRNGEPATAPVEVEATRDSSTAPTVKIELPANSGDTKVEIPVSNVKPGTVAVLVHPDGTEEIVKNSIPTEDGIQLTVDGNATVKVMDNSKNFTDTAGHWSEKNIDFVSARGLLNGTSANTFSPNAPTTRAQLWTVLARQADADLTGGANWYEKAQAWAKEKGISDGANPNGTINRAQMVTMLWRTMGQPAAGSAANFIDVPTDAYYASAVSWAVENGITTGVGGGRFVPTATCTRAQIAAFLARSMK